MPSVSTDVVTTPTPVLTDEEKALAVIAAAEREAAWVRAERIARLQGAARSLLTGTEERPWRRPLLFVIASFGITLAPYFYVAAAVAMVAVLLLAFTDNVTEVVEE